MMTIIIYQEGADDDTFDVVVYSFARLPASSWLLFFVLVRSNNVTCFDRQGQGDACYDARRTRLSSGAVCRPNCKRRRPNPHNPTTGEKTSNNRLCPTLYSFAFPMGGLRRGERCVSPTDEGRTATRNYGPAVELVDPCCGSGFRTVRHRRRKSHLGRPRD